METQTITYAQVTPHNAEAEQAVVGSILIDAEVLKKIEFLTPEDFYIERNRWVYQAAVDLRRAGQDIDYLTVSKELERRGQLTEAGGPARLMKLINSTPSSMHAESYARLMQEETGRRRLVEISASLAQAAFDRSKPISASVSGAIDRLSRSVTGGKGAAHISHYLSKVYDEVSAAIQDPREITGIPTGLSDWDNITGGLQPGTVIKMAGDPGVGKSLLAVQILLGAAKAGHAGALYELEMSGSQVVRRSLSNTSRITTFALRTGKIVEAEIPIFTHAIETLEKYPVYISDESRLTTAELRVDLTRLVETFGVEVAVIDYEALLADEGENENARRNKISDAVHAIAKDLNLAIISIADMTKEGIQRKVSGQGAAAGTGHELHNADEIVFLETTGNPILIDVKWVKLREPNGAGNYMQLERVPRFPTFMQVTRRDGPR